MPPRGPTGTGGTGPAQSMRSRGNRVLTCVVPVARRSLGGVMVARLSGVVMQSNTRLLPAVRQKLRLGHYGLRTEGAYVGWIKRFVRFHGTRHPAELGEAEVVGRPLARMVGLVRPKAREWAWQWVFPARRRYRAEGGARRRDHLHPSAVQRAIKEAARRVGISRPATALQVMLPPDIAASRADAPALDRRVYFRSIHPPWASSRSTSRISRAFSGTPETPRRIGSPMT